MAPSLLNDPSLERFRRGPAAGPGWQPPHPACEELAALLLSRGADANDAQTLYNFTERLELLAAHGFADGRPSDSPSPWRASGAEPAIASAGTPDGVRALAAAGGDLDAVFDGHTMLHHAAWIGDVELVQALLESGGPLRRRRRTRHDAARLGRAWSRRGDGGAAVRECDATRRT
jgi:Ankyrin repeat